MKEETKLYSPAGLGKAYLREMGITPILSRQTFPREVLGWAMTAFYGGRAECRIRLTPVPVTYLDFLSMYPTVNALLGLWPFWIARRVEVDDATEDVRAMLETITPVECFRPDTWRSFVGLVQVIPDGDVLPVRARYAGPGREWGIGVNPLTAAGPIWCSLADVVASIVLTGRVPRVVRAIRLVARGMLSRLTPVRFRDDVLIDPRRDDFFLKVVEERKRLKLRGDLTRVEKMRLEREMKVVANATAYGITAEVVRQELTKGEKKGLTVYGLDDPFECAVEAPEEPGEYFFAPLAACITGGARLMLALLQRAVSEAGGAYAMCDTDSMAVVSTDAGGLVRCEGGPRPVDGESTVKALSWAEVEAIRDRFRALNPYDLSVVPGSILKLESVNFDETTSERRQVHCYSISAKRYALFALGPDSRPILLKEVDEETHDEKRWWSEHGLGHLLNPTDPEGEDRDWIRQAWEFLLSKPIGAAAPSLSWLSQPAMSRLNASAPQLMRALVDYNRRRPYREQIMPFNFVLSAQVASNGHPPGADPNKFHLIAPYTKDSQQWRKMQWIDLHTGRAYSITTGRIGEGGQSVRVKSYADVLADYATHPEYKSLAPDGRPAGRAARGLLSRRPVEVGSVHYIGKESNRLEDVEAGLVHDEAEVVTEYHDPKREQWMLGLAALLTSMPKQRLAALAGVSPRQIQRWRNGQSRPKPAVRESLLNLVRVAENQ